MLKKIIAPIALTLAMSSVAFASSNGFYMGLQGGAADIDNTASSLGVDSATLISQPPELSLNTELAGPNQVNVDNGNWGMRVYGGYQFNRYIAAEVGFTGFQSTQVDNLYGTPLNTSVSGSRDPVTLNATVNEGAIDAVAKAMLPLGNRVNLYAKGGAAYVMTNNFDGKIAVDYYYGPYNYQVTTTSEENFVGAVRPTYGLGASFDITPKLSADVSWSQIVGGNDIPTTNFAALGLAYHFK